LRDCRYANRGGMTQSDPYFLGHAGFRFNYDELLRAKRKKMRL
jgi:hypothetical protein